MKDFTAYLGIAYLTHGRSDEGIDCYGLFLTVQKEVYARVFKDFFYDEIGSKRQMRLVSIGHGELKTVSIDKPQEGCAAILKKGSHVGVYIGEGLILHTTKETGSIISEVAEFNGDLKYYDFHS